MNNHILTFIKSKSKQIKCCKQPWSECTIHKVKWRAQDQAHWQYQPFPSSYTYFNPYILIFAIFAKSWPKHVYMGFRLSLPKVGTVSTGLLTPWQLFSIAWQISQDHMGG